MSKRAIVRTDAVVLRSLDYGETSQIVTLFTRERGKLAVMAKGARRPESAFGSSLQPMSYAEVVFYHKPTRTLQILSESSHVAAFHGIRRSLEKIALGLQIVELVYALMEEEDPQPGVFNLTLRVLRRLDGATERVDNLWPYFQLRMASALGVAPAVQRADVDAVTGAEGRLSLADGGVYAAAAAPVAGRRASRTALRAYAVFARAELDTVLRMALEPRLRQEVEALVDDYLRYHFEDAYPTRSREVIAQLKAR